MAGDLVAIPDWLTVKKDMLDSRRKCNKYLSTYQHYKEFGLNEKVLDLYFNRFSSSIIDLYMQLRAKVEIPTEDFKELYSLDKLLKEESQLEKAEIILLYIRLNELIEAIGVTKIEIPRDEEVESWASDV